MAAGSSERQLAERTVDAYAAWVARYRKWCKRRGYRAFQKDLSGTADHHANVAKFVEGHGGQTANQILAAIGDVTRKRGFYLDGRSVLIKATRAACWARSEEQEPLRRTAMDHQDFVDALRVCKGRGVIGARDAALVSVGWGYRLDRSDLVGLDWEETGRVEGGSGCILTENGVEIELASATCRPPWDAAASQSQMFKALLRWREVAGLDVGDPIFRGVNNRHQISSERLTAHSVSRIVKAVMWRVGYEVRGMTKDVAKKWSRQFGGKSLKNRSEE